MTGDQNVAELHGKVVPHPGAGTLEAPFMEAECVYRKWCVEQQRTSSRRRSSWSTLGEGEDWVPFLLSDGHGEVRVELDEVDAILLDSAREPGVSSLTGTEQIAKEFVRDEIGERTMDSGLLSKSRRFRETLLRPGDEVYVYGEPRDAGVDSSAEVVIGGFDRGAGADRSAGWGSPVSVVSDFSRR